MAGNEGIGTTLPPPTVLLGAYGHDSTPTAQSGLIAPGSGDVVGASSALSAFASVTAWREALALLGAERSGSVGAERAPGRVWVKRGELGKSDESFTSLEKSS